MVMNGLLDDPAEVFMVGNVILIETLGAAGQPICLRET